MARVVVIGAGVAGLGSALTLARRGHDVTVVERDGGLAEGAPVSAEQRRGVPQARHSHAFLARLRNQLRDEHPDVLARLLEAGATELRFLDNPPPDLLGLDPQPGDEDLVALACRRTTFEDVLRAVVLEEPSVRFLDGHAVEGLQSDGPAGSGTPPTITGVVVRGGLTESTLSADVVIDAGGRRSRLPAWLADLGVAVPAEDRQDCGIVYLTRFYRLKPSAEIPPLDGPIGGDLGYFKYMVFIGDQRTFSVTVGLPTEDDELRRLLVHGDAFDAACRTMTATAPWLEVDRSEPTDEVAVMAGLRNQRRRLVQTADGQTPVVLGVHAVGDAAVCTNPLYGRGCSLGMAHARLLADALDHHGSTPADVTLAFDAATEEHLGPWYRASVDQDRSDIAARATAATAPGPETTGGFQDLLRHGLMPAARTDPAVYRAFLRAFNLLDHPASLLGDPTLLARIAEAYSQRHERPPEPSLGPGRPALLATLATA